jgi:hypothetical protein
MITRAFFLLSMILLAQCGWTDNDGTEYLVDVVGNIKLEKQRNSDAISLVLDQSSMYNGSGRSFAVIVDDCVRIYYDSLKSELYVEEYINKRNCYYSQIKIIDASQVDTYKALKTKGISKEKFESSIQGCRQISKDPKK